MRSGRRRREFAGKIFDPKLSEFFRSRRGVETIADPKGWSRVAMNSRGTRARHFGPGHWLCLRHGQAGMVGGPREPTCPSPTVAGVVPVVPVVPLMHMAAPVRARVLPDSAAHSTSPRLHILADGRDGCRTWEYRRQGGGRSARFFFTGNWDSGFGDASVFASIVNSLRSGSTRDREKLIAGAEEDIGPVWGDCQQRVRFWQIARPFGNRPVIGRSSRADQAHTGPLDRFSPLINVVGAVYIASHEGVGGFEEDAASICADVVKVHRRIQVAGVLQPCITRR